MTPPHLLAGLERLEANKQLRSLKASQGQAIDFSSNDYLGLGQMEFPTPHAAFSAGGAGGSRLLTGHHPIHAEVEAWCADYFRAPAALLFNSGYHANLGLLSSIAGRHDTFLYDEQVHASIKDGMRLSPAKAWSFPHQDLLKLESLLQKAQGTVYIVVEALYSMDGDLSDIGSICQLADAYGAWVVLDEAHSTGLYGPEGAGWSVAESVSERIFARVYTFGKAAAWMGAVVVGSKALREHLLNKARTFIYTTALPPGQVVLLKMRLERMREANQARTLLFERSDWMRQNLSQSISKETRSPIVSYLVPGNEAVKRVAHALQMEGFDIRPILAPTVKSGTERLRIILHTFNSTTQVSELAKRLMSLQPG